MKAPAQSDIVWENVYREENSARLKSWFLLFLLFWICIFVVTPISLVDNLSPLINSITGGDSNFFGIMV
jgi:hypothetical protein